MSDLINPASGAADATLDDDSLALVLEYVDGELQADPVRRAAAEALMAASATARAMAEDWTAAKVALREQVLDHAVTADLSHVRGRVMSKLPVDPRPAVAASNSTDIAPAGIVAWLRKLGFGKVSFAVGLAAAAAIWLLATQTGLQRQDAETLHLAAVPEPGVIIEDMDIESGTVLVSPEAAEGGATVIWHFDDHGGAG